MKHRIGYCFDKFLHGFCAQIYTKHVRLGASHDGWRNFEVGVEVRRSFGLIELYVCIGWISFFLMIE